MTDRLDAIRQRAEKATKGPWTATPTKDREIVRCDGIRAAHNHPPEVRCWEKDDCPGADEIVTTDSGYYGPTWPDAEFIAHAREDIPFLLAELDTLRHRAETAEHDARVLHEIATLWQAQLEAAYQQRDEARKERDALADQLAVCRRELTGAFRAHRDLSHLKR